MPNLETAVFGGGCFWCLEAVFQRLPGVKSVESGYMGGRVENPTYKQVCTGTTGHAEVVRNDEPMLVALRYRDVYRRTEDGWRFQDRLMSYMYYVSVRDYAEALKGPLSVRAYGDKRPAHWPEALYGSSVPAWLGEFVQ